MSVDSNSSCYLLRLSIKWFVTLCFSNPLYWEHREINHNTTNEHFFFSFSLFLCFLYFIFNMFVTFLFQLNHLRLHFYHSETFWCTYFDVLRVSIGKKSSTTTATTTTATNNSFVNQKDEMPISVSDRHANDWHFLVYNHSIYIFTHNNYNVYHFFVLFCGLFHHCWHIHRFW